MTTRRDALLGLVVGATGFGLLSSRTFAWYYDELTPDQAASFAGVCRAAPVNAFENHAGLIAAARQDLVQRIANGLLPAGAREQVGCPVCGCSFIVTVDGTN